MSVHPKNQKLYNKYKFTAIAVYVYEKNGKCPRCRNELVKNQFGNYECTNCYRDYLFGRYQDYVR